MTTLAQDLAALTLTATEAQSGYSDEATNGGPDVEGLLSGAVADLEAAQTKLTIISGVIPGGSNATAINAVLNTLNTGAAE